MSRITGTLARRRGIGAKDRSAEVGTGIVAGQGMAEGPGGDNGCGHRAANAHQGRSPRGGGRQGFGKCIEPGIVHTLLLSADRSASRDGT